MRRLIVFGLVVLATLALASPALAFQSGGGEGVSVHLGRDAAIDGPPVGMVVIVGANLDLSTNADTVVVLDGSADITAGSVGTLIIVDGTARLGDGVEVVDVWLTNGQLDRDEGAVVTGTIRRSGNPGFAGRWLSRIVVALGFALLTIIVGLIAALTASRGFLRAAATVTERPGPTALAAVTTWFGLPLLLVLIAVTLIGLPLTILGLVCVLPVVATVGYAVVGLRIGQAVLRRGEIEGRPLMPTFVGIATLVVLGQVPGIGLIITLLATFVGGGAVTLTAWTTARGPRKQPPATAPMLSS